MYLTFLCTWKLQARLFLTEHVNFYAWLRQRIFRNIAYDADVIFMFFDITVLVFLFIKNISCYSLVINNISNKYWIGKLTVNRQKNFNESFQRTENTSKYRLFTTIFKISRKDLKHCLSLEAHKTLKSS